MAPMQRLATCFLLIVSPVAVLGQFIRRAQDIYDIRDVLGEQGKRIQIIAKIEDHAQRASREGAGPFEELGIDSIIVDEAHLFKKQRLYS